MLEQSFIIYGAGQMGKMGFELLSLHQKADYVYGFCDKAYQEIKYIENKKVFSYKEAKELGLPFLLAISGKAGDEVAAMLESDGQHCFPFDILADWFGLDLPTFRGRNWVKDIFLVYA